MALALDLARKGAGWTSPNPMVGAVIVKDGQVIGQGYHAKCGDLHAERAALANCQGDPAGATIYVTLEPCCHHGRQPPCTDAILEAGITRVVVGSGDPNPLVAGKGLDILRSHGIAVTEGVLDAECKALNDVFFHYIQTGRPYVVLKYSMTLDGKLAAYTGASQWITGEEARRHVHTQRSRFRSIMVGVDTVIADVALHEGNVVLTVELVHIAVGHEVTVLGGHLGHGDAVHQDLVTLPIGLQIPDGDELEAPLLGHFLQLGGPHHGTVFPHDLAAQTDFLQAGKTRATSSVQPSLPPPKT